VSLVTWLYMLSSPPIKSSITCAGFIPAHSIEILFYFSFFRFLLAFVPSRGPGTTRAAGERSACRKRQQIRTNTYLIVDGYVGYSGSGASEHIMRIVSGEFSSVIQTATAVSFSDDVTSQTHRLALRIQQRHPIQMLDRRLMFRSGQVIPAREKGQVSLLIFDTGISPRHRDINHSETVINRLVNCEGSAQS